MAWNGLAPYTKALQYLMDNGTAIGDVVGGELSIEPNVSIASGIGGQSSAQGGVAAISLRVDLVDPVLTYISGMPRATASTQSTNYDFECGTADGDYNLTLVQPAGFSYEIEAVPGTQPRCTLNYMAARIAEGSTGDSQEASAGFTDCSTDFDVTVDTADVRCRRAAVTLATNPQPTRSLDAKTATYERFPDAYVLGGQGDVWTCQLDCEHKIALASSSIVADAIDQDIDIVITGTSLTFTLSSMLSPPEVMPFEGGDGIVLFRYNFQSLPGFGLCQVG